MKKLIQYLNRPVSIAPLAMFRILFGFIMLVSIIRFTLKGWIKTLYIEPQYYFTFYGFEWVKPLGATGMYAIFLIMALAALMIMLGYRYRLAAVLFFLSFTYVELIDKSNYLNHYYFVSIIGFLMILLPANRSFSVDTWINPTLAVSKVPAWTIVVIKLQIAIVYFYAGAAKLNPDWLLEAMPLRLWLPANAHLPVIGGILDIPAIAYVFSWFGAIYDLTIVFFLLYRPTRIWAYMVVLIFHLSTAVLFQIGMFPYVMVLATLIFFTPDFHEKLITGIKRAISYVLPEQTSVQTIAPNVWTLNKSFSGLIGLILITHFLVQLLIPLRSKLYPGELFWTEQGYRFPGG